MLYCAEQVRAVGLAAKPELNGRLGTVKKYDEPKLRVGVEFAAPYGLVSKFATKPPNHRPCQRPQPTFLTPAARSPLVVVLASVSPPDCPWLAPPLMVHGSLSLLSSRLNGLCQLALKHCNLEMADGGETRAKMLLEKYERKGKGKPGGPGGGA